MKHHYHDPTPVPAEEPDTRRHRILLALTAGPQSLRDLSAELHMPMKEIATHLEHVQKTLAKSGVHVLEVIPAECRKCGFVFKKRDRVTKPGRCPVCRGEYIQEPLFSVKERDGRRPRQEQEQKPSDCSNQPSAS